MNGPKVEIIKHQGKWVDGYPDEPHQRQDVKPVDINDPKDFERFDNQMYAITQEQAADMRARFPARPGRQS